MTTRKRRRLHRIETHSARIGAGDVAAQPVFVWPETDDLTAAYDRRLAEIEAVEEDAFPPLNLDGRSAVATVFGVLPQVRELRDRMAQLPEFDMALVDGLEDYAEAAAEADSRFVLATEPEEDVVVLNAEGIKIRETLRWDARALANRGLIHPAQLDKFNGFTGYKNVGFELVAWATLMRQSWHVIEGKTALTAEEVRHAKQLGERLVRAAGLREQAPVVIADVTRIRRQALALLVKAYAEVRRGVRFLCDEEDIETIAPSLYQGRPRKKSAAPTEGAADPAGGQTPAAAGEPAPAPVAHAPSADSLVATTPVATGLPNNQPFVEAWGVPSSPVCA